MNQTSIWRNAGFEGEYRVMRKFTMAAVILFAITLAGVIETMALASETDFGLGIWVSEEGSDQWESVTMGFSWEPRTAEWNNNYNADSNVHIVLGNGLACDIRDFTGNWVFYGSILCDNPCDYDVLFGYIDCSTGGPWDPPMVEPKITFFQNGFSNSFYLPLEWDSTNLYMGGNFDFTVDFNSSVVPEPSSLLAIGLGLSGLGGLLLHRRAA